MGEGTGRAGQLSRVFRTYFLSNRGDEALGSTWSYLDMTALGRQETWEDSPRAIPRPRLTTGGTGTTNTTTPSWRRDRCARRPAVPSPDPVTDTRQ
ncbi:MAG: DUF899 family protein [Streptosporangiaceae bacterium]